VDALSRRADQAPPYLSTLLIQLAHARLGLRQFQPMMEVLSLGLELYPDFTDLYFAYGSALMEFGDASVDRLDDVRMAFESCLQLGEADPRRYESVSGVGSYRALHNLGAFFEATGATATAREHYQRAAEYGFEPAAQRLEQLAA
jgi:tetratricopeptide (TPR) repeat protein